MSKIFPERHLFPSDNLGVFKRVMREIEEVNGDPSLRTAIQPDPEGHLNLFYFTMVPNDGAMAHQPLVGRMIIPGGYPAAPPVIHLFTETRRYNVDVYRSRIPGVGMGSSMCFDILRSKKESGTWDPEYTISALIASLMQSIVSMTVPQEYGRDVTEAVSMEKLADVKKRVEAAYEKYQKLVPKPPAVPLIEGLEISARTLDFPFPLTTGNLREKKLYSSDPFYLQTDDPRNNVTASFDLSGLHPQVVFSVILSNVPTDPFGQKSKTILLRNGVTGSAAKKRSNKKMGWFYHGIPLNRGGLKLTVTVANDQFTMVYWDGDRPIVHGDTPISFLSPAEIGDVRGMPFFLTVLLCRKSGDEVSIPRFETGSGFIHPGRDDEPTKTLERQMKLAIKETMFEEEFGVPYDEIPKLEKLPVFVGLEFSPETTEQLKSVLEQHFGSLAGYPVVRGAETPAHVTLIFHSDLPLEHYHHRVALDYLPHCDTEAPVRVTGYVRDGSAIAFLADLPTLPVYPTGKQAHITMALNGKPPVYSNQLIDRIRTSGVSDGEEWIEFSEPVELIGRVVFKNTLRVKRNRKLPWMV